MKALLFRHDYLDDRTLGELCLYEDGVEIFKCKTLELPWKENEQQVSCIPEDQYVVRKRSGEESGSFDYEHFHIKDVPERSWILIHAGNYIRQILGCILVGKEHADIDGDGGLDVTHSRDTLQELLDLCPDELTIRVFSW